MKQVIFLLFIFFTNLTFAQDQIVKIHSTSSVSTQSRYEVIQSTLAAIWTFRLDRVCGQVHQLVSTKNEGIAWQSMKIHSLPKCISDGKIKYQLFTSGLAARHTFLINTDTGKSWQIRSINKGNQDEETVEWFPFDD